MRIGIDARFFGGEQSKGLGRYTQKLVEQLLLHDSEHEYVLFLQDDAFRSWKSPHERVTAVRAPYRWYTFAEQIFLPLQIWRARVDFMHFPHFNVPLLFRGRFVVTIHDLIIILFPTERATTLGPLLYRFKHWAGQMVMRHAVKDSMHVITVSEFSKKDIVDYYHIAPEKITVTYEAAERDYGECSVDSAQEVTKRYRINGPYILYVGNAYPHKNLEVLLRAVKEIKENEGSLPWQLVLVGRMDYFYKRLQQTAWALDIDQHVVFTGFVPDADLPCLYSQSLAYIFPSQYEGFGLPSLEAMLYHTPVISSNSTCLPEILGDAALYFDSNDISGIIKTIQTVANDRAVRDALIVKGDAQTQRYSWRHMMEKTRRVYDRCKKETTKK